MLRLRHLRLTLLALFAAWALFFLKVIRKSSFSSASDAVPKPKQLQYHPLLPPKKSTKNDWSSSKRPAVMSLPKVDFSISDLSAGQYTTMEYRPFISNDDFQNQSLSLGFSCETLPAQDPQDGGLMGYQVLKRMQFFLRNIVPTSNDTRKQGQSMIAHIVSNKSNFPQSSVLCVLADFSGSMQNAVLETYGQDCDGVAFRVRPCVKRLGEVESCQGSDIDSSWKVVNMARNQTTIYQPGLGIIRGAASLGTAHEFQDIFRFLLDLEDEYTWIHWASPHRYVVLDFLRFLLQSSSVNVNIDDPNNIYSQPMVLESWNMDDPGHSKYTGLYGEKHSGGCGHPRTFNQQTVRLLAHNCSGLSRALPASTNLTTLIDSCLAIHEPQCQQPVVRSFKKTPWLYLQRYYEIQLVTNANNKSTSLDASYAASLHRVHAILHGICDSIWDRPLGALDKDGTPGYIHDPTFLKRNPLPFTFHAVGEKQAVCDIAPGEGEEGAAGYQGLRKIRIASDDDPFDAATGATGRSTKKRVLCMVYTHSSRHDRLRAVAETWGPRCDGFLAASDLTDETIGAVHLLHEGPEHYRNMWLKVYSMWRYVYDHYRDDYDFFHIGGDDHYVIAENLHHTVSTGSWKGAWNDSEPLYLGGSLAISEKRRYCNGGSGYTLNRVALKMLVQDLFPTPRCWPHWQASDEDKIVASCFRSVGIQCMDTNDDRNETRYHTWNADQHADWSIGKPAQDWAYLPNNHGIAWKEGLGQISETSVSFHLKKKQIRTIDSGMRRYHAILYGLCSNLTTSALRQ